MTSAWLLSLLGGALIGGAASLLLVFARQTAGISGILAGALEGSSNASERSWRVLFLLGLLLGGITLLLGKPGVFGPDVRSLPWIFVAAVLVGVGTRLSGGCTSGHGVCGLSQVSARSLVATLTFIAAGVATVFVLGPKALP